MSELAKPSIARHANDVVTLALFGAGRMGQIHGPNVARFANTRLKYVIDPSDEAARKLAAQTGATVVNYAEAFADDDIDAIIIASSADTHADLISNALKHNKAVFCEKPLAKKLGAAIETQNALDRAGASIFLGFNRRFDKSFQSLHARLRSDEIGKPELILITSRDPQPPPVEYTVNAGGMFRESMIHDLDMAYWLLGEEPTEVYCVASSLTDPAYAAAGEPDTAVVTLKTKSGTICSINQSWRATYGYDHRVEVHGALGMLQLAGRSAHGIRRSDAGGLDTPALPFFRERYDESYAEELSAFTQALLRGESFSPNQKDGVRSLLLAECVALSHAQQRPVKVEELLTKGLP